MDIGVFFWRKVFELGGFLDFSERALECRAVLWKEPWYSWIMWRKSPTVNWRLERVLGQTGPCNRGLCGKLRKSPRMQGCSVGRVLERRAILWKESCNTWLFCGKSHRIEGSFAGSFVGSLMLFCGKSPLQKGPWIRRV